MNDPVIDWKKDSRSFDTVAEIKETLEQEGGKIEKPYEAVAYIARKRGSI
jgi:hypothetical protein